MSDARSLPVALSIAALDPSGGAGLAADLRTFAAESTWGCAVATAVTFQSTAEVAGWEAISPDSISRQLEVLLRDVPVAAAKTGMVGTVGACHAVAASLQAGPAGPPLLVIDPVLWSSRGESLGEPGMVEALVDSLFPLAALVTPNLDEAGILTGHRPESIREAEDAAREIAGMGAAAVLVTGGHGDGDGDAVADVLWAGGAAEVFEHARIDSLNTHGTGCVLTAAITAALARGESLRDAVLSGRARVRTAISAGFVLGSGSGPVEPLGSS